MLYIRASELILLRADTLYPLTYITLFPPPSKFLLYFVLGELGLLELDSLAFFENVLSLSFWPRGT